MELSQISSRSYRPRIKRLSNSDLQSVHRSQSESAIRLSRIPTAAYKPRVTRVNKDELPTADGSQITKPQRSSIRGWSQMSSLYYRHRITPMNGGDLQSICNASSISFKTVGSERNLLSPEKGISLPVINGCLNVFDHQSEETKKRKKTRRILSPWAWFCCLALSALLLAIIAAILLAILLPKSSMTTSSISTTTTTETTSTSTSGTTSSLTSTSSTTSTTTKTSTSSTSKTTTTTSDTTSTSATTTTTTTDSSTTITTCASGNGFGSGLLATISGSTPSYWTQYNYTYIALTTSPILTFSFSTDLNNNYFLDTLSVTRSTAPSIELLQNPSFENSTTMLNGWVVWCNWTCSAGGGAQAMWGTNCYLSTGNCFLADCPNTGNGAIVFLGQPFSAVIGATYIISFRLRMAYGAGGLTQTQFTASIN